MWIGEVVARRLAALVVIAGIGLLGACRRGDPPRTRSDGGQPTSEPKVVTRVDVVTAAEGCAHGASLIVVGLDKNGDGVLSDDESHGSPTKLCTNTHLHLEISHPSDVKFCPQPNRVIVFGRDGDFDGRFDDGVRHNIVVCLDKNARLIRNTYVVYGIR